MIADSMLDQKPGLKLKIAFAFLVCLLMSQCLQPWEKADHPFDRNDLPVKISQFRGGIYIAEDYNYWKSNSIIYMHANGIVFLDGGWTYKSARQIIWKASSLGYGKYIAVVPTSLHLNRTGGLSVFRATRIKILMQRHTPRLIYQDWKSMQARMSRDFGSWRPLEPESPNALFMEKFNFMNNQIQLFYFGPGLSPDNVIVYFPEERVVYAGNLLSLPIRFDERLNRQGYIKNLNKISELDFDTIIAGQGDAIHGRGFLDEVRQAVMRTANSN